MNSVLTASREAAKIVRKRKNISGGNGRQNRTLSLKVGGYQKLKDICKAEKLTLSEVIDDLIISFVELKKRDYPNAGKAK